MKNLLYTLRNIPSISQSEKEIMFQLMTKHYDRVNWENFTRDLSHKQYAGLVLKENSIVGFTTFAINPNFKGDETFNVIFSGDTIIDKEYWGSQILSKGWLKSINYIMKGSDPKSWYWFLISKGYRTYLYLPIFFNQYYPAAEVEREANLMDKIDYCARLNFARYWDKERGTIEFETSQGQMNKEIDTIPKNKNEHINFFLQKNPNYKKGVELACMVNLAPENYNPIIKRFLTPTNDDIQISV